MTPLGLTALLLGGLLIPPAATAAAAASTVPDLVLASVNDAVYLVEADVYDGSGASSTLDADPRALLAGDPLSAGPLLAGRILAADEFGVTTRRWSDRGWISAPSDSVASTPFAGRAAQPLVVQWGVALAPDENPAATIAGELALDNRDGGEDATADLGVDGRAVTIKRGAPDDAYDDFATVFSGYGVAWQVSPDELRLTLRARGYALSVPLAPRYGGTGGADGGADIEGRPIPALYGTCRNVTPVLVSTASLIFQVHGGRIGAVDAVYDRRVPLVFDGDYGSYAALAAATITAGRYATCLAAGLFRLASTPVYPITADIRGDASTATLDGGGYVSSPALMVRRILLDRGALPLAALDLAAIEAAHAVSGGAAGIYFTDPVTVEDAVSAICAGAFLRWGQNRDGTIAVWRIAPPAAPAAAIGVVHLLDDPALVPLPGSVDPCLWRVVAGYQRNWTVMTDADIAGAVSADDRQFARQPYRTAAQTDTARLSRNLLARSLDLPTIYDGEADATTLASNLLTLFDQGRRLIEITLPAGTHPLALDDVHRLTHPRLGLAAGVDLRVVSLREDCGARELSAVLFG